MMRKPIDPGLRLQPVEKKMAYGLAAASLVAFTVTWTVMHSEGPQWRAVLLGAMFSLSLAIVASQGHRLWTAFASFITGMFGPWDYFYIVASAYIAFAFWLAWRAHRAIKASLNPEAQAVKRGRATPVPARKQTAIDSGRVTPKGTAKRRSPKRK